MSRSLRDDLQTELGERYTVERELTGGGMSRVFVAEEKRLNRQVVVKVLESEAAFGLDAERFEREIQVAARLQHPHIVPVIAAGDVGGIPYYTMPFVRGESLRGRMRAGPLPLQEAMKILADVASALAYAHAEGLVHRDIKPENILLSSGGAVVTDFGIAKALTASRTATDSNVGGDLTLTAHGTSLGTPAYMAPEQAAGDSIDARADVYSWGVLAYELLSGEHPFSDRKTAQQLMVAHLTIVPKRLKAVNSSVPAHLASLVASCLEKNASRRPASGGELAGSLGSLASGQGARQARIARFRRPALWVIAAVAVALAASGAVRLRNRAAAPALAPAVMVMPFQNLSGDTASEYFSDGMTEELVGMLQRSGGLRVASRATTFSYKGKQDDPRAIGEKNHVDAIVTGSVRRAQDQLRIAAELVMTADGEPIWSETYDRSPKDVFGIQEEISRAIAISLKATLAPKATDRPRSADLAAYDYYLQALKETRGRATREKTERVISLLEKSIARDSSFAPAWAQLSQAKLDMAEFVTPLTVLPRAKEAANRAVKIDPTNGEVALALADIRFNYDWDWSGAEREYRRAISLDPELAAGHRRYAMFLIAARREREAFAEIKKASELQLKQATDVAQERAETETMLGFAYAAMGDSASAMDHVRRALALAPADVGIHWRNGLTLAQVQDFPGALRELKIARGMAGDDRLPLYTHVGVAYGFAGQKDSARHYLRELTKRAVTEYIPKDQFAALFLSVGDRAGALRLLEQAIDERHYWLPNTNNSPHFSRLLRNDPQFRHLMKRLNVPDASL